MSRVQLLETLNKGLRVALFQGAMRVGRTDFSRMAEVEGVVAEVRRLAGFLGDLGALEEEVVLPEIAQRARALGAELGGELTRLRGLRQELEELVTRLLEAPAGEREALGRRLHERLGRLVAAQLLHQDLCETQGARILRAHLGELELADLERRLLAGLPAARKAAWIALVGAAVSTRERVALTPERAVPGAGGL